MAAMRASLQSPAMSPSPDPNGERPALGPTGEGDPSQEYRSYPESHVGGDSATPYEQHYNRPPDVNQVDLARAASMSAQQPTLRTPPGLTARDQAIPEGPRPPSQATSVTEPDGQRQKTPDPSLLAAASRVAEDHGPANLSEPAPTTQDTGSSLPLPWGGLENGKSTELVGLAASHSGSLWPQLSPKLGRLVAGLVPIDVAVLERGAEAFFAQLENLGGALTDTDVIDRLAPWIVAVASTAVSIELVRRQLEPQDPLAMVSKTGAHRLGGPAGRAGRDWVWSVSLTVFPPSE
jgi:hypothetical protein